MDYAQVEEKFKSLKLKFLTGELDEAAFKAQLEELMVQDESGRWWMIGFETGHWYVHDGAAWVRSEPPKPAPSKPAKKEKVEFSPSLIAAVEKAKYGGSEPVPPLPSSREKIKMGPLPPATQVKKMGWGFWLGWFGSIAAGIGVFAWLVSVWHFSDASLWAFAIGAGTIGFFQWLVMRQYLPGSAWWIPANAIYMGITAWIGQSGGSTFAYFLLFAYGIINIIVMPVVISRKRRST